MTRKRKQPGGKVITYLSFQVGSFIAEVIDRSAIETKLPFVVKTVNELGEPAVRPYKYLRDAIKDWRNVSSKASRASLAAVNLERRLLDIPERKSSW